MPNPTPGPWTARAVVGLPDEDWWSICAGPEHAALDSDAITEVAIIPRRGAEDAANARLCAAAPDLLAALQLLVEVAHVNDLHVRYTALQNARDVLADLDVLELHTTQEADR